MRKGRRLLSGMLGFWLWLAGMPANHDTVGQWLAAELPRAHADISGTITANTSIDSDTTVNPALTVAPGVTLTLNANLLPVAPGVTTLTNNGAILNNYSQLTTLNIVNNGSITMGTSIWDSAGMTFGSGTVPIVVTNNGTITNFCGMGVTEYSVLDNYGTVTNNRNLTIHQDAILNNYSGGKIINNSNSRGLFSAIIGTLNNYSGGTVENSGELWLSGTLNNSGAVTNKAGGVITNQGLGTFTNNAGGTFTNQGNLNNQVGGLLTNYGTLKNSNSTGILTNRSALDNYGLLQNTASANLNNYGTLTNKAGGTVDNTGTITNNTVGTIYNYGTFTGSGPANYGKVENYGTFSDGGYNYGTFQNTGTITGGINNLQTLTNNGTIGGVTNGEQAFTGGILKPTTAELYNYGTINALSNYGKTTNYASGVITLPASTANYSGEVINNGSIVNNGTFNNSNDQSSDDGAGNPLRAATLTNNAGGTITNSAGATFQNMGGAAFNNNGTLYNYGSLANMALTVRHTFTGTVTNTGVIYNHGWMSNKDGSSFTSSGAIYNYNAFTNSGGATFTSSGAIYNYGTFTNAAGATLNITGGTVYGPIVNNGTFNVSGGSFTLPTAGQTLSITNLSGAAAFRVAGITAGSPAVTVTTSAAGSHTLTVTGASSAAGTVKAIDLPVGSTATFSGGGDVGAYACTLARGSALGLDAEDYYFASSGQPSSLTKTAMGMTASATTVWYGEMNEIRKRMGELRLGSQSAGDFWARGYAGKFTIRPAGADSSRQLMRGFELGRDNPQSFAGGKKYTGVLAGYGTADNSYASGATGATASTYLGAYGSWLRDDGSYFDLIGKYNWFTPRFTTATDSGRYAGTGLGLSAELGKRFARQSGVFVEPAAELTAFWAKRASYTTAGGLAVDVPAARSLQLRLGVTAGREWQDKGGASRQFYGKFSWVKEYQGDSTTRVDGASFDSSLKGRQWVAGLGFVEDTGRHQFYLDAERSWGTTVSKDWGLNVGCRWKF